MPWNSNRRTAESPLDGTCPIDCCDCCEDRTTKYAVREAQAKNLVAFQSPEIIKDIWLAFGPTVYCLNMLRLFAKTFVIGIGFKFQCDV